MRISNFRVLLPSAARADRRVGLRIVPSPKFVDSPPAAERSLLADGERGVERVGQ
jgi:hypothetical protein